MYHQGKTPCSLPRPAPAYGCLRSLPRPGTETSEGEHLRRQTLPPFGACACNVAKQRALSGTVCAARRARRARRARCAGQPACDNSGGTAPLLRARQVYFSLRLRSTQRTAPRVLVSDASVGTGGRCTSASLCWDLRTPCPAAPAVALSPRATPLHTLARVPAAARCCTLLHAGAGTLRQGLALCTSHTPPRPGIRPGTRPSQAPRLPPPAPRRRPLAPGPSPPRWRGAPAAELCSGPLVHAIIPLYIFQHRDAWPSESEEAFLPPWHCTPSGHACSYSWRVARL